MSIYLPMFPTKVASGTIMFSLNVATITPGVSYIGRDLLKSGSHCQQVAPVFWT